MALEQLGRNPALQGLLGAAAGRYARDFVNTFRSDMSSRRGAFSGSGLRSRLNRLRVNAGLGPVRYHRTRSRRLARSRFKVRYAKSRTMTRTRTKKRKGRRGRRGVQKRLIASGFTKLLWRKLCTPMTYKTQIAQVTSGVQALRSYWDVMLGGEIFLKKLGDKHPSNFLFNTALGSASTSTLQDPGGYNYTLCIDKLLWKMKVQNRSNASMELKVYECVARHDITNNTVNTGKTGVLYMFSDAMSVPTFIGQAESNIAPGQSANVTGVTNLYTHPSFTPYMSNEFCSTFKILRTKSLVIPPNHIVPMNFSCRPKKFKGQWLYSTQSSEWQRGWSKVILFSWVGMPVDDGTTSNQSKGVCDLFLQAEIIAKYHFEPGNEPLNNLSYLNDVNTMGQQYQFNPVAFTPVIPASDTVQTVAGSASASTDVANAFAP